MSRHRRAYDDDDLYDYEDDYDDYDDGYDDPSQAGRQIYSASDAYDAAGVGGSYDNDDNIDYVQFVMESLGTVQISSSGTRVVGSISEARVLQMLEAYDYDMEKTVDYFLKQRATVNVNVTKVAPQKQNVPINLGAQSMVSIGGSVGKGKNIPSEMAGNEKNKVKPTAQDNVRVDGQNIQDLSAMGFGDEADKFRSITKNATTSIFAFGASATAAADPSRPDGPANSLLTSAAPLSDDELDDEAISETGVPVPHISLVVAGHVDAGKSTLVGNLLYKIGNVTKRTMHKYEKESHETGKGSFALAWVMDESQSEREHGVTIDIAERHMQTENRRFTVLDAPGHRDFIPNMISGATQADVALLVVPAATGEYESSMSDGAQTREHAVLLKALGVSQIVVVVNKMDAFNPAWDQGRFLLIETQMRALLEELQFPPKAIRFVPLSGLSGVNLITPPGTDCALSSWYTGPTLLQAMDTFKPPVRRMDAPLRAVITSVLAEGPKGCDVSVSVLQGRIRVGRGVGLASAAGAATVKKVSDANGTQLNVLVAGEKGTVQLIDRSGRSGEEMSLSEGMVLCKGPPLPRLCRRFRATILTMAGLSPPIIPGSSFELYLHGEEVLCRITKLYNMTATSASTSTERNVKGGDKVRQPKCIGGARVASVRIQVDRSICIEPFKVCGALGRFALRAKGKTCAVGVCEKISVKMY